MESNKKRGKLIVIEGIDGCGKTTQVNLLKEKLDNQNFYYTREASDGAIGKLLRSKYLVKNDGSFDERVINLLYAADRFDHVTNTVDGMLKYLNDGINVITDRYYLSSMAYNSYMGKDVDEVIDLIHHTVMMNKYTMDLLRPDLTIYIDVEPGSALYRIDTRNDNNSIYETTEKLMKIHDSYNLAIKILRNIYHENIISINGNDDPLNINNIIVSKINDVLNKEEEKHEDD